jgi:hypothetical protein
MRFTGALLLGLLLFSTALPAEARESPLPAAWHLSLNHPDTDDFTAGITDTDSHGGKSCGFVRSGLRKPKGWGDVNQGISAKRYRGKRLRYSVWLKAIGVKEAAGLWMRVDGEESQVLAFDSMLVRKQPLSGSTGWKRCQIVLDVPPESERIAFGINLTGEGALCFDDVRFDVVGEGVPTTNRKAPDLPRPQNLNFEN